MTKFGEDNPDPHLYLSLEGPWFARNVVDIGHDAIQFSGWHVAANGDLIGCHVVQLFALRGLLDKFAKLGSKDAIVYFAERFGCLDLCVAHRLPGTHYWPACAPLSGATPRESFEEWDRWIRQFAAARKIISALRGPRPNIVLEENLWHEVRLLVGVPSSVENKVEKILRRNKDKSEASRRVVENEISKEERLEWIARQRSGIARVVSRYLDIAGVRSVLTWTSTGEAGMLIGGIHGNSLMGTLAMQLAAEAAGARDQVKCAECHIGFTPLPRGSRTYCSEKCEREARRHRDRDRYAAKKLKSKATRRPRRGR